MTDNASVASDILPGLFSSSFQSQFRRGSRKPDAVAFIRVLLVLGYIGQPGKPSLR